MKTSDIPAFFGVEIELLVPPVLPVPSPSSGTIVGLTHRSNGTNNFELTRGSTGDDNGGGASGDGSGGDDDGLVGGDLRNGQSTLLSGSSKGDLRPRACAIKSTRIPMLQSSAKSFTNPSLSARKLREHTRSPSSLPTSEAGKLEPQSSSLGKAHKLPSSNQISGGETVNSTLTVPLTNARTRCRSHSKEPLNCRSHSKEPFPPN